MSCQNQVPCLEPRQRWMPTKQQPYPMTFSQAPSPCHQIYVTYDGKQFLQGLSPVKGPYLYPIKRDLGREPVNSYERKHCAIVYPTTHSIPGPYLRSFINLPSKTYMY